MKKRIIKMVMITILCFSETVNGTVARAAPAQNTTSSADSYSNYYADYLRAIDARCSDFQEALEDTGTKQYGLLFQLRILTKYMLYNRFLIKYREELQASEPKIYEADLKERIDKFNNLFNEDSSDFKKCKLEADFDGLEHSGDKDKANKKAANAFDKNLGEIIPEYLKGILKGVQEEITAAGNDAKKVKKIKKENTTLLTNVFEVYQALFEAKSELTSYTPFDENRNHVAFDYKYNKKTIESIWDGIYTDYGELQGIAQKSLLSEETDEEITIDLSKSYVENLSDAVMNNGNVEIPEVPKLTLLYYAIMAASAVYVPLQSYAGNSEFQAALKCLTNDDQVQAEMVEFYSAVKDIRKPLYKRNINEEGIPDGTAKIMTIQDLIDDIQGGNSGALCTVLGDFRYNSESNSWLYYQSDFRTIINPDYEDVQSNSSSSVSVTTSADEELYVDESVDPDSNDVSLSIVANSNSDSDNNSSGDSTVPSTTVTTNGDGAITISDASGENGLLKMFNQIFEPVKVQASSTSDAPNDAEDQDSSNTTSGAGNTPVIPIDAGTNQTTTADSVKNTNDEDKTITDTAVFAYSEITDETKLSESLYFYSKDYIREVDNMTYVLLYNVIANSANLQYISDRNSRYLYVNAFGDIVTDDNLIIFPGIANPAIYASEENYNIYTAAFMNSYPSCYIRNSSFKLTNKNDIGKYIIVRQKNEAAPKGVKNTESEFYAVKTQAINAINATNPIKMKTSFLNFSIDGTEKNKLMKYKRLIFGSSSNWNADNELYTFTPLVTNISAKVNGTLVFPYIPTDDVNKEVAEAIATNMYWYLTTDTKTGKLNETSRFNENFILNYFILNGVNGTNNPKGYNQNSLEQYERFVKGAPERFLENLKGLSKNILSFTSGVRGIIGLRESMQSPILGKILIACRGNMLYFLLFATIVLLYIFARMKIDLFRAAVKLSISLLVAYLGVTLVPTYIPMIFNVGINNVSENLTYKILSLRAEGEIVGIINEELDQDGFPKFNNESLTLYKAGVLDYETFLRDVNAEEGELIGGNIEIINQESGIFVEGDSVKINVAKLFNQLKIIEDKESEGGYYKLKAYKTVSNNVDYYTPFYLFVDSFVEKELNVMNSIYDIPKSVIVYSNGVSKENFLVYSFVNSQIFLTPGDYGQGIYTEGLDPEEVKKLKKSDKTLQKELKKAFGESNTASDFLQMNTWIYKPTKAMKQTLWAKTMQKNNYYDSDWKPNTKKLDKLITHVNYQTKRFIFAMDDQIGKISDETLIKLIALRANIDFNQQISEPGNWVYPFSLNYGDFTLGDVASAAFVSDYNKYTAMDFDVINYAGDVKGWFNLIVMDILLVLMFLVCNIIQLLVPIMYLMLYLTVVLKLLAQGDAKLPVKGFTKCMVILMVGYTLFATGLSIAEKLNGSVVAIYSMLAICLLIIYILFVVISALITNAVDMGNSAINAKIQSIAQGNFAEAIRNLNVTKLTANNRERTNSHLARSNQQNRNSYNRYSYGAGVNDMYRGGYNSYGYGNGYNSYGSGYGGYNPYSSEYRDYNSYSSGYRGYNSYGSSYNRRNNRSYSQHGNRYNNSFNNRYVSNQYEDRFHNNSSANDYENRQQQEQQVQQQDTDQQEQFDYEAIHDSLDLQPDTAAFETDLTGATPENVTTEEFVSQL